MKLTNIIIASIVSFLIMSMDTLNTETDYLLKEPMVMLIKGSSNIHDWESTAKKVNGYGQFGMAEDGGIAIENCLINIDVKSIKSSKGSIMDKKTWKALKADQYSNIIYRFNRILTTTATAEGFKATVEGTLSIAGTKRVISLAITGKSLGNGDLEIAGTKALKMTDFNIEPPTALLGALTTADDITIEFRMTFGPN